MDQKKPVKVVCIEFIKLLIKFHILHQISSDFKRFRDLRACLVGWFSWSKNPASAGNGTLSSKFDALPGVIQGSALGPTLFSLFINDSLYVYNNHKFLFADDWTVFSRFPKHVSDFSSTQTDLNSISEICSKMQMQISIDGCKVLILNDGHNDRDYFVHLSGNEISNAPFVKDLGLVIDS